MNPMQWWLLSLAIGAVVVVVVAVLLGAIIGTARSIDRHANAIWVVGKQIAGNTVSIWMLEKSVHTLERVHEAVQSMNRSTLAIEDTLRQLADRKG
jgi:hypothetical protein